MSDEWYTQPMSDYGSAYDSFAGQGGGQEQMPMDSGPAFQDWGSYGALSGGPDPYGMGPMVQGQQPDNTLQSMQMGLNQAGGQDPAAYSPQIQPSGGGSWFKQLLSTTIFGMAQGAGQQDPGTAFAAGYMGVEAQKERERQMMLQQQKAEQEKYMFQLDRTKKNMEILKLQQEMENAPIELQNKSSQAEAALYNSMAAAGKTPMMQFPATPEGLSKASAQMKEMGVHPGEFFPLHVGSQIVLFAADPKDIAPAGTQINVGGVQSDMGGMPWSVIKDLITTDTKNDFDAHQNELDRQNRLDVQASQNSATIAASQNRASSYNMNNVPEDVNLRISGLRSDISAARNVINNYDTYKTSALKPKAEQASRDIVRWQQEIDSLIAPYQSGTSVSFGSVHNVNPQAGGIPHITSADQFAALPAGSKYYNTAGVLKTKP